eukprot:TRINITY_DN517_c0_g1_i1.p2 TRINITY_DN517_c0_g1~~TRINITY_DN517_c0_g1_i1.p2  ORF type:complete len:71 (-),score=1.50 TRINITY_DN517_c0_g1_i1:494-706(-)
MNRLPAIRLLPLSAKLPEAQEFLLASSHVGLLVVGLNTPSNIALGKEGPCRVYCLCLFSLCFTVRVLDPT